MTVFDHEKLDVYRVAIDFVALADDIVEHLPRGRRHIADQLLRASVSVLLSIAEGAGRVVSMLTQLSRRDDESTESGTGTETFTGRDAGCDFTTICA